MLIPIVTFASQGKQSFTIQKPRYFEPMLRAVWGPKMDGLEIVPSAPGDQFCYVDYPSVEHAERELVMFFASTDDPAQGNARTQKVIELFHQVYPNGLKEKIEALIREDVIAVEKIRKTMPLPQEPHQSFLDFGLSSEQACALQARGWLRLDMVPTDIVDIAQTKGVTSDLAVKLADRVKAVRAENQEAVAKSAKVVAELRKG